MNLFNKYFIATFLTFVISNHVSAEEFSDCLLNPSTRGKVVFVLDEKKMKSASEVFEFLNNLEPLNLRVERVLTSNDFIYHHDGSPATDHNGDPVTMIVQKITARVFGYKNSDFVDQNGVVNLNLAEEFDKKILDYKLSFPAIIRTECPLVPGPGGRVGG